jgi:hypothetical protein
MTAQISEKLIYEGKEIQLFSNPLSCYLSQTGIHFQSPHTANWRGYVGTWKIIKATDNKERLYLTKLSAHKSYEEMLALQDIFPDSPNGVFAHWYTGTLRCPMGDQLEYVHMGYGSKYEYDLLLEFKRGVLVKKHSKNNNPNQADESYDKPAFPRN